MKRRNVWLAGTGLAAGAIVFAGWFPGYRLHREIEAARAEGLWTKLSDLRQFIRPVAPNENAAPLILESIALGKARNWPSEQLDTAVSNLLKGKAAPRERDAVRAACRQNGALISRWRAASSRPKLDFGRNWEKGYSLLLPELNPVRKAARFLVASAIAGVDPEENLLSAARLSNRFRQEPRLLSQIYARAIGAPTLHAAKALGFGRSVDAALGKPWDARFWIAIDIPMTLDIVLRYGEPGWYQEMGVPEDRFWGRLIHAGPWKANAQWRIVHEYRVLLHEMPKDGTDYAGVIRVLNERMPRVIGAVNDMIPVLGQLMGDPATFSTPIQHIQRFEQERKKVRAEELKKSVVPPF